MALRPFVLAGLVALAVAGCPDSESPAGPWDAPRIDGGAPDAPPPIDAPTMDAPSPADAPATDAGTSDAPTDDAPVEDDAP